MAHFGTSISAFTYIQLSCIARECLKFAEINHSIIEARALIAVKEH